MYYGDDITSPLALSTDTRYCLYIISPDGTEELVEICWYRSQAREYGDQHVAANPDDRYEIVEEEV